MNKGLILAAATLFVVSSVTSFAAETKESLLGPGPKAGWLIFGYGVLDSAGDVDAKEIVIDVDWSQAAWGVGSQFTTDKAIAGKKLKAIRAEIKTVAGSKARVFGGISTPDDANLVFPIDKGIELSSDFRVVLLPVAQMRKDKPDVTSRMFTENDWDKIQNIKILFGKPLAAGPEQDRIVFRNPELIFE